MYKVELYARVRRACMRLTHRVHILEMNGESYRLRQSRQAVTTRSATDSPDA